MVYNLKKGAYAQVILAAAVADDATFTVAYPTGFTQLSFTAGLAKYGDGQMVVNGNDVYDEGVSGFTYSVGASEITVTNTTGASLAAGTKLDLFFAQWSSNNAVSVIAIPITLAAITGAGDVVTEMRPGIAGYITDVQWVQGTPVTTAAKAATLNLEIDTTNLTGGTVALTSAACTPLGARVAGAQITAANRLEVESKLSVEAASVTAFVEGAGTLYVTIRRDQP